MVKENGNMYLSQPGHIAKMTTAAGLVSDPSKPMNTPMRPDFSDFQNEALLCDRTLYSTLLGMLIFVIRSRPDVAYAINRLATRSKHATERDLLAIKRVIHYLSSMGASLLRLLCSPQRHHL